MNILALIAAIIGVVLMSLTVIYGNRIKNRWLRYLSALVGLVLSVVVMGSTPALLGDSSLETSGKAGEYMVYLIVVVVVIKSIFFRKKASKK